MTDQNRGQPIKDLRGFMTEQEVHQLIDGAMKLRDKVLIRLLWVTGARISEVVGDKSWYKQRVFKGAKVSDIDFKDGNILLDLLKRRQYPPPKHLVPLDKITLDLLQVYIQNENLEKDSKLFPITRERAFQILREVGESVGIVKVGAKLLHNHHLRHSHCVAYIRKNNTMEGLRKLQEAIGHASISTTAQYLQFGLQGKKETEDIFGQW